MNHFTWTQTMACAALVASLTGQAHAQADATLSADADTTIKASSPVANFGKVNNLNAAGLPRERTLVRFDQSKLTAAVAGRPVVSASLELSIQDLSPIIWGNDLSVHRLQKAWTETGATWSCANDTAPTNSSNNCTSTNTWAMTANQGYDGASSTRRVSRGQTSIKFDVTADVKAFLNGSKTNNGWLLKLVIEGPPVNARFRSREAANGPKLVLDLGGSAGPGPVGSPCTTEVDCGGYANPVCFSEADTAIPGGYCSAPCATDSECPSSTACVQGFCALPCNNGQCSPGYYCLDTGSAQACFPTCTTDADCSGGRQCAPIINECRPPE